MYSYMTVYKMILALHDVRHVHCMCGISHEIPHIKQLVAIIDSVLVL